MQDNRIETESMKAHFIIAMPGMLDPNFAQTVTCVCEHSGLGALGVIINRVHPSITCKEIFEELSIDFIPATASSPIYMGGPVHLGEIFILHGPPFEWKGCLKVTSTLGLSNTKDTLEAIAMGRGPESYLIILGCAGWGPLQLESELMQNAWLTNPVSENIIFDIPIENRWEEAVKQIGIDPTLLTATAGHA